MKRWKVSDISESQHLGILEFNEDEDNKSGEWHIFEILETPDRLVFGGSCNTGFVESGYILKDELGTEETLQELYEDLQTYYRDGKRYCDRIVCNERM